MTAPEGGPEKQDRFARGAFVGLIGVAELIGLGQILATGTVLSLLILGAFNIGIGAFILAHAWHTQAQKAAVAAVIFTIRRGAHRGSHPRSSRRQRPIRACSKYGLPSCSVRRLAHAG